MTESLPLHRFFTTTVSLVTSAAPDAGADVMACEWTFNIGYRPLLVLVLVGPHDLTHELITASGQFGVNLCTQEQAALTSYAGNVSGRSEAKLESPVFAGRTYPAQRITAPMIRGCLLNLECEVERSVPLGLHTGFVGRAVAGRVRREARPLIYHQGRYFGLGDQLVKPVPAMVAGEGSAP